MQRKLQKKYNMELMQMGYHEGLGVTGMFAIVLLIFLIFFMSMYMMYDKLEFHVTLNQQQTVDSLQNSLKASQEQGKTCEDLVSRLQERNKIICNCDCPSPITTLYGGFILGGLAVIVVQIVGKWMFKIGREYEIKRKEKKEKDKK
jgi:hypothetical protein